MPLEPFTPQVLERDWGQEVIVAVHPNWTGKILRMRAGTAGNLQYHVERAEAFHLVEGKATVEYDVGGRLVKVPMVAGETWIVPEGEPHRVRAETFCVFFEVSDSPSEDRVRVESKYGEPEVPGLPDTWRVDRDGRHTRIG